MVSVKMVYHKETRAALFSDDSDACLIMSAHFDHLFVMQCKVSGIELRNRLKKRLFCDCGTLLGRMVTASTYCSVILLDLGTSHSAPNHHTIQRVDLSKKRFIKSVGYRRIHINMNVIIRINNA